MLSRNVRNYQSTPRNIPKVRRPRPKNSLEWKPDVMVDEFVIDNMCSQPTNSNNNNNNNNNNPAYEVKVTLEQAMKGQKGSKGTVLLFL